MIKIGYLKRENTHLAEENTRLKEIIELMRKNSNNQQL